VKVLHTKGEGNCIPNYRPVSCMVLFSNVFEKGYVQTTIKTDYLKKNLDLGKSSN
jgi:hypothetical protein